MSIKLMHEVFGKEVDHSEQAVLLAMADHADDEGGSCFPSVDRIAYKTGYKPRNVIRVMGELRQKGVLEVVAHATAQRSTEYRIHLERLPDKQPFIEWRALHGRHAGRGAENAPVQSGDERGAKSGTKGVHPDAPKPSLEPSSQPSLRQTKKSKGIKRSEDEADRRREGYEWLFDQ